MIKKPMMDFNSFINKESFKAILLQHLKCQVNAKFGHAISNKIKECSEKEESTSPDLIIPSVSKGILDSEEFPKFSSTFLKNVDDLLDDEGKYVPKESKYANSSQCSSASSMNVSSIDFLSPDQFQDIVQSLTKGTNPEKLEALGMLHRLPTLEHISQQCLWSDIEGGLHESLSSSIVFLRDQSLKLYIKMLSCPEPKVVQESFLSLIKYLLEVLPFLNKGSSNCTYKYRSAVQIITILNKFLQSISSQWLRYPQSLIESITMNSLKILSKDESTFPTWTCIAICDPEAKWLKNIMHGHVSRSALLLSLEKHLDILHLAIDFCEKFSSDDTTLTSEGECCQKSYLTMEITHMICFLSQLLQYSDGRSIFDSILDGKVSGSWINVLNIVMSGAHKLCRNACFKCCAVASGVVSKKWLYIWASNDGSALRDSLIQLLMSSVNSESVIVNDLFFTMQCLSETVNSTHVPSEICMDTFVQTLLVWCFDIFEDCDMESFPVSEVHLYNSSLILVKRILLVPSMLLLNLDFMKVFVKWWFKVKQLGALKMISNSDAVAKLGVKITSEVDQNVSSVFMQILRKPTGITICHETSFIEVSINILLEKILKDINTNNSVCSCDIAILSNALNAGIRLKSVLNKTLVFRLSSIIWQLSEQSNDHENFQPLRYTLEILLSSIFCDLFSVEICIDVSSPEILLYYHVLLFPNKSADFVMQEEHTILALQVISLLTCSVQSLCLLQSKFKIAEILLELQHSYTTIEDNQVIDPISILLNHILVKLYTIGGPNERNLPVEIFEGNDIYVWPFIKEFPIPSVFYHNPYQYVEPNEITVEENVNLKDTLLNYIQFGKPSFDFILQLLKDSVEVVQTDLEYLGELHSIVLDDTNADLHDEELVALPIIKRYGKYLALISEENEGRLEQFLNASKHFIGAAESTALDVFVCTIYLMCKEDSETAFLILKNFAKSCYSFFIWQEHLIQASKNHPHKYVALHDVIFEVCDLIVNQVFPDLFLIFQSHGILPSTIYSYWTKQCYWNYLNFEEICHFLLLNVLFSGEFSLYFFCAVLKHSHSFILQHSPEPDLYCFLVKNAIQGFKVSDYIDFMSTLSNTFHEIIYNSLAQFFKD